MRGVQTLRTSHTEFDTLFILGHGHERQIEKTDSHRQNDRQVVTCQP